MACFTPSFVEWLLIWLVVFLVAIACVKAIFPAIMRAVGAPPGGGVVITVLGYLIWGAVAIVTIVLVFDLIGCVLHLPPLRA